MNIVVCDNIKDMAMELHKQIEQQIQDPASTKEECEKLVEAQESLGRSVRFLLQAIGLNVERVMSRRQV